MNPVRSLTANHAMARSSNSSRPARRPATVGDIGTSGLTPDEVVRRLAVVSGHAHAGKERF